LRECPYFWQVEFNPALLITNWDEARICPLPRWN
jgi:hypothetical protein